YRFLLCHTQTSDFYTLSLHDALPICDRGLDLGAAQVGLDLALDHPEVLLAGGRSLRHQVHDLVVHLGVQGLEGEVLQLPLDRVQDRKSTRLNSSHVKISYAVFCLKKK